MKVYFDGNFWGHKKYERAGTQIPVDREFMWGEQRWRIPAVYSCVKGLVMDFCILIPREEVEAYLERWGARLSDHTREEREQMERENPFSIQFNASLEINGVEAASEGMCAIGWHPCERESACIEAESEELMDAYECDRREGWWFVRACFLWPAGKRQKPATLSLDLKAHPARYFGTHFITENENEPEGAPREIKLLHPITSKEYKLSILDCHREVLPEGFPESEDMEYPRNFRALACSVEPEISREEFRIEDCAQSDQAREKEGKKGFIRSRSGGVSAIGIIGGADGPDEVSDTSDNGERRNKKETFMACSALHFEPVGSVEWRPVFHWKERENKLIEIILSDTAK